MLSGVTQNPEIQVKMPKPTSLWQGAKNLLGKVWDNRSSIMSVAAKVAPFLMAEEPIEPIDESKIEVCKVAYLLHLRQLTKQIE